MGIKFGLSRGFELFCIGLMLFSLMALFQETSIFRQEGLTWQPHLISGIQFSGVAAFIVTIVVFHIAFFIVITRSVIVEGRNKTSNWIDYVVGFLGIIGIYFVAMSTFYVLYKNLPNIEFLFNISTLTLMRIGFGIEALVTLWFGLTE